MANVQGELNSALDWLDTLEKSLLDSLREKWPCPADAREASDPRDYSVVSVNAMLLDLSRRGLVKRTRDLEWESGAPNAYTTLLGVEIPRVGGD